MKRWIEVAKIVMEEENNYTRYTFEPDFATLFGEEIRFKDDCVWVHTNRNLEDVRDTTRCVRDD